MTAHDPRVTLTEAEVRRIVACLPRGSVVRHDLFDVVADLLAARLAPIRALAEMWASEPSTAWWGEGVRAAVDAASAASAPVSASQDDDGAEGQGESERAGEGDVSNLVHNHPPYRPICAERFAGNHIRGACLNDDGSPR